MLYVNINKEYEFTPAIQYTGDNIYELTSFVLSNDGDIQEEIITENCNPETRQPYLLNWLDEKTPIYIDDFVFVDSTGCIRTLDADTFKKNYKLVDDGEFDDLR